MTHRYESTGKVQGFRVLVAKEFPDEPFDIATPADVTVPRDGVPIVKDLSSSRIPARLLSRPAFGHLPRN